MNRIDVNAYFEIRRCRKRCDFAHLCAVGEFEIVLQFNILRIFGNFELGYESCVDVIRLGRRRYAAHVERLPLVQSYSRFGIAVLIFGLSPGIRFGAVCVGVHIRLCDKRRGHAPCHSQFEFALAFAASRS